MKKSLKILLIFCLISFSIVLVKASTPMTWEEIRDKIWHEGDTLTAQNFDIVVQKIAEFNGLNNFLGMFDIVVDKVKEIDEKVGNKLANIFSDESGNVGIGTETPTQKLEVSGNIKATGVIDTFIVTLGTKPGGYQNSPLDCFNYCQSIGKGMATLQDLVKVAGRGVSICGYMWVLGNSGELCYGFPMANEGSSGCGGVFSFPFPRLGYYGCFSRNTGWDTTSRFNCACS